MGGGKGATGASISPLIQIIEKIFGRDVERWTVIWHTINLSAAAPPTPPTPPAASPSACSLRNKVVLIRNQVELDDALLYN